MNDTYPEILAKLREREKKLIAEVQEARMEASRKESDLRKFRSEVIQKLHQLDEEGVIGTTLTDRLTLLFGLNSDAITKFLEFNSKIIAFKGQYLLIEYSDIFDQSENKRQICGLLSGESIEVTIQYVKGLTKIKTITFPFKYYLSVKDSMVLDEQPDITHGPYIAAGIDMFQLNPLLVLDGIAGAVNHIPGSISDSVPPICFYFGTPKVLAHLAEISLRYPKLL